jgi:hypothetical protein
MTNGVRVRDSGVELSPTGTDCRGGPRIPKPDSAKPDHALGLARGLIGPPVSATPASGHESTTAKRLERWRRRRAFARLQKCSLCGRRDWDRESTRVFCHPPNHRVHARQFRSRSRSLQPSFVHSEPGGAAPTIKRNAAKKTLDQRAPSRHDNAVRSILLESPTRR